MQETRHWDEDAGTTKTHALEGGGVRLPLLPRARHPRARARRARGSRRSARPCRSCPRARRARYEAELGLKPEVARVLVADRDGGGAVRGDGGARRGRRPRRRTGSRRTSRACATRPRGPADLTGDGRSTSPTWSRLVADGTVSGAGAKQALEEAFADRRRRSARSSSDAGSRQVSDAGELGASSTG